MKKNQFIGTDFSVVEKFKAPIEKFDTNEDFQKWAESQYIDTYLGDYEARSAKVHLERREKIAEWNCVLKRNKDYTSAEKLLIMNAITKDLKPNNDTICPTLNPQVLDETINELRDKLDENKHLNYDFTRMYEANVSAYYKRNAEIDENSAHWIIIPSQKHDPEHFEENVEKLRNISSEYWCTRHGGGGARIYLRDGDFHLYMEKGAPKLAIRFDEDEIREVQSELNDWLIPAEYLGILEDKIDELDTCLSPRAEIVLAQSKNAAEKNNKIPEETEEIKPAEQTPQKHGIFEFLSSFFKKN